MLLILLGEEFDFIDGLKVRMLQILELLVDVAFHFQVTCELGGDAPL